MKLHRIPRYKHTVCLRHVDPRCVEDSAGPFYCSLGVVTALCSLSSHLFRVFINDARGFLDPFLAMSLWPQPNTAVASYVIRRHVLPSCVVGPVGILGTTNKTNPESNQSNEVYLKLIYTFWNIDQNCIQEHLYEPYICFVVRLNPRLSQW